MAQETQSEDLYERFGLEEVTWRDRLRKHWMGYLFILPVFVMFTLLFYVPILRGIWMSFTEYTLGSGGGAFVGLENFQWVVTNDLFVFALGWTLVFVFSTTLLQLLVGLVTALSLNELRTGLREWTSAVVMSPYFSAPLAGGVIWFWFLSPEFGAISRILYELGLPPIYFLSEGLWPYVSLIVAQTWHDYAYAAIIYLAALQGIPREQYEAASMDGASRITRFREVTVPHLLTPTIIILAIRTAYNISEFAQPFELTGGGPGTKTMLLSILTYQTAYVNNQFPRAYVIGLSMMAISLIAAGFYIVTIREEEELYI